MARENAMYKFFFFSFLRESEHINCKMYKFLSIKLADRQKMYTHAHTRSIARIKSLKTHVIMIKMKKNITTGVFNVRTKQLFLSDLELIFSSVERLFINQCIQKYFYDCEIFFYVTDPSTKKCFGKIFREFLTSIQFYYCIPF